MDVVPMPPPLLLGLKFIRRPAACQLQQQTTVPVQEQMQVQVSTSTCLPSAWAAKTGRPLRALVPLLLVGPVLVLRLEGWYRWLA
jgi:hypothetical protein